MHFSIKVFNEKTPGALPLTFFILLTLPRLFDKSASMTDVFCLIQLGREWFFTYKKLLPTDPFRHSDDHFRDKNDLDPHSDAKRASCSLCRRPTAHKFRR